MAEFTHSPAIQLSFSHRPLERWNSPEYCRNGWESHQSSGTSDRCVTASCLIYLGPVTTSVQPQHTASAREETGTGNFFGSSSPRREQASFWLFFSIKNNCVAFQPRTEQRKLTWRAYLCLYFPHLPPPPPFSSFQTQGMLSQSSQSSYFSCEQDFWVLLKIASETYDEDRYEIETKQGRGSPVLIQPAHQTHNTTL